MSGRPKPLRRWWPLLAALAVVLASWWGLGFLARARRLAARPLRSLGAPLALAARSALSAPETEAEHLRRQLLLLKIENASLRERLDRDAARAGEPHLVFPDQRLAKLLPCALLFRDPAVWFKDFSVDVGEDQDVRSGAGVLTADGVVGRLAGVGRFSSDVLLLSAPNCHFSARLARTGLQCVVSGDGRDGCLLEHLGGQDDVRVGDLVETGIGSLSFPSGIPVGKVVRLARLDEGLRLRVEVAPTAQLDQLGGLYVWVGDPRQ